MQDLISRPPRTIMEVFRMLPEGTLAELIDGIIYMSPSPIKEHQKLIIRLAGKIDAYLEQHEKGEVYVAPFDVYLDERSNAVQPDIVFVLKKNLSIIKKHIHGVPDLIVEVLSEGNKDHDTIMKKDLYERCGVSEYWIIDPMNKEAVGYFLEDGRYAEFYRSIGRIQSKLLGEVFEF